LSACLAADCGKIDWREGAPKVSTLGDIGSVGGNQSDFGFLHGRTASPISFFTWWTGKIKLLTFPIPETGWIAGNLN
jgi:hypothetical protein